MANFAETFRQAARRLKRFSIAEASIEMGITCYEDMKKVRIAIRDFRRRGEIVRVGRGTYEYAAKPKPPTVRQRLWNVIRRMNGPEFTIDDLQQLTGCNRLTIRDFCKWLVQEGHARHKSRGRYMRAGVYTPEVPQEKK